MQDRTGQDRTGQDRTGQDRTGQDRTGQDRTGQDRTGQDRTGQDINSILAITDLFVTETTVALHHESLAYSYRSLLGGVGC
jgi:hypothetical protein